MHYLYHIFSACGKSFSIVFKQSKITQKKNLDGGEHAEHNAPT